MRYSVTAMLLLIVALLQSQKNNAIPGKNLIPFNPDESNVNTTHHQRLHQDIIRYESSGSRIGEFLIDTSIIYNPAAGGQEYPSVAFDGTNYLIVWAEDRSDLNLYDIYGARVNGVGHLIDTTTIAISTATDWQTSPAIAFDGTNYLVVWRDDRSDTDSDIYVTRVDQAGNVLDPEGIGIATTTNTQVSPSVDFDGTNYLIVWQEWRSGSAWDICCVRVSQLGTVLDSSSILIATGMDWQESPSIAFGDTNYLVVWQADENILCSRVDQNGTVLDPGGIPVSTATDDQENPSVVFAGNNYLVAWQDARNGGPYHADIYGARVSQAGAVLDPTGIAISTATATQGSPSVSFDGTNIFVTWGDTRSGISADIYGARVDQRGFVRDPDGIAISVAAYSERSPAAVSDGTNHLVVWEDFRSASRPDIYCARVHQSGNVLDSMGIAVSIGANGQTHPDVAFDGTNYLVVWSDNRSSLTLDIYAARIDQSGVVLDSSSIMVSPDAYLPAVAFDGTNYLVVWEKDSDIYGARMNQVGIVLDPDAIAIVTNDNHQWSPSIAFDGINYLVVWSDQYLLGRPYSDIYGARVNQAGIVLDSNGFAITTAAYDQQYPCVAFDGTNYLVVWEDDRLGSDPDIFGSRVTPSGVVIVPGGIAISTAAYAQKHPKIAFDGTNYLVVWEDWRNGTDPEIYGARVAQTGAVLDPNGLTICSASGWQWSPSTAFDGTDYVVAWQDWRNGIDHDICGAKIDTSGMVVNTYIISGQSGHQLSPALAHGTSDSILITYSGWTDSINTHPANAMRIWGKFYPFVGIEDELAFGAQAVSARLHVFPNPFSKQTCISCAAEHGSSHKKLNIYNVTGNLVRQLSLATVNSSSYASGTWYGLDDHGNQLPTGIYFCRLEIDNYAITRKIVKLE